MTSCCYQDEIDEYLLNRLSQEDKAAFEEHYFNCKACFQELKARAELLGVIKSRGQELFRAPDKAGLPLTRPRKLNFKPALWGAAAAGAVALIVFVILVTRPPRTAPTFTLSGDDTVRGQAIGLISPRGDIAATPVFLEWSPLAQGAEYTVSLFDQQRLWSETTQECRIRLPEEVRQRMVPGQTYSWQVKAFSPQGALTAISSRLRFKIAGPN
ncbi:MAG TPA: zf-HC2 domain-containing protein [Acidobacteriota bacterium]